MISVNISISKTRRNLSHRRCRRLKSQMIIYDGTGTSALVIPILRTSLEKNLKKDYHFTSFYTPYFNGSYTAEGIAGI